MSDQGVNEESVGGAVVRGITISGIGNAALRLIDFAIAVILLRWLLVLEFGIYRLVLAGHDLFSGFFLAGLDSVVVSDVSRNLKGDIRSAKSLYSVFAYFLIIIGIGLWALFFWGSDLLTPWFPNVSQYLRIVSFIFLLSPLETIYLLSFSIFLDFGWGTFFRILRDAARLASLIIFFSFLSFGVEEALWSLVIGRAVPVLVTLIGYRRESLLILPSWEEFKGALTTLFLNHGKWALLDDFIMNIGKNIRPFIIKLFAGTEAVAIFSVAQNLIGHTTSLFPIRDVLTPVFPRVADQPEQMVSKINRATKYATFAYIVIGIGSAIAAPIIVYVFFPNYIPSLPLFYILLVGLPWLGFRSVVLPVFYALKEQKTLFKITILRLTLITVLSVVLIYMFGVRGAALESLLLGILLTPAFAKALHRILPEWKLSLPELFKLDAYDKQFLLGLRNRFLKR